MKEREQRGGHDDGAGRQGWSVVDVSDHALTIRTGEAEAWIELRECGETGRCRSGVIRTISYHFFEPDPHGFWHWNLKSHGATGFGPSYVTLQRYIQFHGVTDDYLSEVIGTVWPRAAQSFWAEVERREAAKDGEAE